MKEYLEAVTRFARVTSVPLQRVQTLLGIDQVSISTVRHDRVIFLSWKENEPSWMVSFVESDDASVEHFSTLDAAIKYIGLTVPASGVLAAF